MENNIVMLVSLFDGRAGDYVSIIQRTMTKERENVCDSQLITLWTHPISKEDNYLLFP